MVDVLTDPKVPGKLAGIQERYERLRFAKVADVPVEMCETGEHFRYEPGPRSGPGWRPASPGDKWGGDGVTAWFRGDVTLPVACESEKVLVRARTGGETLFFVDGVTMGVFDRAHPVVCMTVKAAAGATHHLAFEAYAGHTFPGTQPFDTGPVVTEGCRTFDGVDVVLEREDVTAFVFDLKTLRQLVDCLDANSVRRGKVLAALGKVWAIVDAAPEETPEAGWRPKLARAREVMRPLLELHNGPTVPQFAIIGASHIDTAWLWPIAETWRKCARTFSSALNLMDQYPEMIFLQPAPCHAAVMKAEYPELFARMKQAVEGGRWEPNGAMWVEPDCNVPSGESFVRQVLLAQSWTRENFGYAGDTLWLPDVFGYSAALPQILRLGGVRFFCTTKMGWNDTTRFPYDTFRWRGIDGTAVIANLNEHNSALDPETLTRQWNWIQHKDLDDRRLCAYGHGDGGGGPMAEMLEAARRMVDLEGCPRARHRTLSDFMCGIEREVGPLPEWSGELYLELHRGTLTSIAKVKRGNRKSEVALREAEFLSTLATLGGADYPAARFVELWQELCLNQFHDILPGSSIAQVNDEAVEAFGRLVAGAEELSGRALAVMGASADQTGNALLVANSLSWDRAGEIVVDALPDGLRPAGEGVTVQRFIDVCGRKQAAIAGVTVPALSTAVVPLTPSAGTPAASLFRVTDYSVETPFTIARADHTGKVVSFFDKASGRDLVGPGGAFNTFFVGEDIPRAWDNWDIDADQELKMEADLRLVSRNVASLGPLQLRIRSEYRVGESSRIAQDVVFHSTTPRVDCETVIDWHEKRKLLKAVFDLGVLADTARHEIQYGHVERPTHRNLPGDRARFEVCAHKWTDLSDGGFGVALLNDCKYGVSVHGGRIGLSLIKAGVHPDPRGDEGKHFVTYSLLPHAGPFTVESVIRPAYELNIPATASLVEESAAAAKLPVSVSAPNIIIEAVKWAEEGRAFIVRLYEAGRMGSYVDVTFGAEVTRVTEVNILEEHTADLPLSGGKARLFVRPFEIKTLRCEVA